jgi:hypothetical protein
MKIYIAARKAKKLYQDPELHTTVLQLIFRLMLTPKYGPFFCSLFAALIFLS